ncbi:MAG TPA: tetratricopeptide repeat protein [Planctomycetia bacterium]|jgi:tetratricopeptide (TPR) repeat protein|nr:tetratricopeptide repeat protein [Planctomycetia bacterium]
MRGFTITMLAVLAVGCGKMNVPSIFSENPDARWDAKMRSGLAAMDSRQFATAEFEFGGALETAKKLAGAESKVAISAQALATCKLALGQATAALALAEEGLAMAEKLQPADEHLTAMLLLQQGRAHELLADFPKAEQSLDKSLELFKSAKDAEGEQYDVLMAQSILYQATGRPKKSQSTLAAAIELQKKRETLGKESEALAALYCGMGRTLMELDKFDEAGDFYQRATLIYKAIREQKPKSEDGTVEEGGPTAAETWVAANATCLLTLRNQPVNVVGVLSQALRLLEERLSTNSREVLFVQRELGRALLADDKAELAESLLRKNLNSTQELFAKNHTEVAKTLELFADALRKNDHKHEADEAMARAKEIFDSHKSLREVAVVSGKTPGG